jgi:hypothetical protein
MFQHARNVCFNSFRTRKDVLVTVLALVLRTSSLNTVIVVLMFHGLQLLKLFIEACFAVHFVRLLQQPEWPQR